MEFLGDFRHKLDTKKRLFIPAKYRSALAVIPDHEGSEQTVVAYLRQADGVLSHLGADVGRYS